MRTLLRYRPVRGNTSAASFVQVRCGTPGNPPSVQKEFFPGGGSEYPAQHSLHLARRPAIGTFVRCVCARQTSDICVEEIHSGRLALGVMRADFSVKGT